MRLHDLKPAPGSSRARRRVGRGTAGKGGKTAGRGTKGLKARGTVRVGFEGGQLPLKQRIPKLRGFNNPFRVSYVVINLDDLADLDVPGDEITPEVLRKRGMVHKNGLVKVLGRGEISRPLKVSAHAFSRSAEASITAAGGTVTVIAPPHGDRRVPAQGSSHTNR
ncbi:MAG: 50S ribosomal protein L15 [Actinobacteria bacterium]|nr:50S ribosomal protein L15 [Actinomycetota bacterium]